MEKQPVIQKYQMRRSAIGGEDYLKELEKLYANRASMSRHRQIQLML